MKRKVLIINRNQPHISRISAEIRLDFWGTFRGLMFQKTVTEDTSLILDQKRDSRLDSSIHMLFMNFDIAAIWVNAAMQVVDTRLAKRWALAYMPKSPARYIIEGPVQLLDQFTTGDQLEFRYE